MRIGLDISAVTTGTATGIETYTRAFLKVLGKIGSGGHTYYVFTTRNNASLFTGLPEHIQPAWLPGTNSRRWWRLIMEQTFLPYISWKLKLDVVNFQSNLASVVLPCASVLHIKTLHHFQDAKSIPWDQRLVRYMMYQPSARRADVIIANTENTKREICYYFKLPESKVVIISEGVDTDLFHPFSDEERGKFIQELVSYSISSPYVLFVSSLFPYKNASTLIRSFAQAVNSNLSSLGRYQLVIVGGDVRGHMSELHQIANEAGIANQVIFVGHVGDRQLIRRFYAGADLFVYPSHYETFGLTVLEAMACGTPVIAANTTSLPEVVGDAGVLVDPSDVVQLAKAIGEVLTNPQRRHDLIERGKIQAARFSWESTVKRTIEAYERAVHEKRNRQDGVLL